MSVASLATVQAPSVVEMGSSRPSATHPARVQQSFLPVVEKDILGDNAEVFALHKMLVYLSILMATGTKGVRRLISSFKYTRCERASRGERAHVKTYLEQRVLLGREDRFAQRRRAAEEDGGG